MDADADLMNLEFMELRVSESLGVRIPFFPLLHIAILTASASILTTFYIYPCCLIESVRRKHKVDKEKARI